MVNPISYPWRETDNLWHAIVAEIMLQRTKVNQVLPAYEAFVLRFQTPQEFVSKNDSNVFSGLGLSWRNDTLKEVARTFIRDGIPKTQKDLLSIAGIGDYISSAIVSLHWGKRASLVDSNIIRLYGRFFGFSYDNETRRKKWFQIFVNDLTPQRNVLDYNYAVLDCAMIICKTRPRCNECHLRKACTFYKNK